MNTDIFPLINKESKARMQKGGIAIPGLRLILGLVILRFIPLFIRYAESGFNHRIAIRRISLRCEHSKNKRNMIGCQSRSSSLIIVCVDDDIVDDGSAG